MKKLFKKDLDTSKLYSLQEMREYLDKQEEKRKNNKLIALWWKLGRYKDKAWTFLRYDIKYGVKNLWRWKKVIWHDRDWDYHYLLEVMKFKLVEMEKLQRVHGNSVDHLKYAKEIEDAIDVIQRLIDDDYLLDYEGEEIWKKQEEDLNELMSILNKKLLGWWD